MLHRKVVITIVACAAAILPAVAEPLGNDGIRSMISGRNVVLSAMGFEFPLYYSQNGSVTGDGTQSGLAKYFTPKETGQWWVSNDRLCQRFPTWYEGRTWCFDLQKAGDNRLRWRRDDGFTGKARITS